MPKFKAIAIFNIKSKPYMLLGFAGFLMGVLSFFRLGGDALDISLHDTYYVIATSFLCRLIAALLLFLWSVYIVTSRHLLSKYFTWLHVIATLSPIIFIFIALLQMLPLDGIPRHYYHYGFADLKNQRRLLNVLTWLYPAIFAIVVFKSKSFDPFSLSLNKWKSVCLSISLIFAIQFAISTKPSR